MHDRAPGDQGSIHAIKVTRIAVELCGTEVSYPRPRWPCAPGSHVNALFKGRHSAEFAWFALGDALPVSSMDARRGRLLQHAGATILS